MEAHTFMLFTLVMGFIPAEANYSCYSCPLSEATSIDTVYNKHISKGDFWYRNGSALVSCDFLSIYASKRKCSVCVKRTETVVMVLCNLTSGEEPIFEGKHGDISFNKTNCPQPEHIGVTEPNSDSGGRGHIILVVCLLAVIIIVIIIIVIIIIMWKRHQSQKVNVSVGLRVSPNIRSLCLNIRHEVKEQLDINLCFSEPFGSSDSS